MRTIPARAITAASGGAQAHGLVVARRRKTTHAESDAQCVSRCNGQFCLPSTHYDVKEFPCWSSAINKIQLLLVETQHEGIRAWIAMAVDIGPQCIPANAACVPRLSTSCGYSKRSQL